MKKVFAGIMSGLLTLNLFACGSGNEVVTTPEPTVEATAAAIEEKDEGEKALEAIGNVEVEDGLFSVTITIPADYVGDMTQEELDEGVSNGRYHSAKLNEDGSVTYELSKKQHQAMMDECVKSLEETLAGMIGSEDYPDITKIEHNDNFTSFTVTTRHSELDLAETFATYAFYIYGAFYGIFDGLKAENIKVEWVNEETGDVIDTGNSKDLE